MSAACDFEGFTVGETGACALERDPATCEQRTGNVASSAPDVEGAAGEASERAGFGTIGAPVLASPTTMSSFKSRRTLGPVTISQMLATRYDTVDGILGA